MLVEPMSYSRHIALNTTIHVLRWSYIYTTHDMVSTSIKTHDCKQNWIMQPLVTMSLAVSASVCEATSVHINQGLLGTKCFLIVSTDELISLTRAYLLNQKLSSQSAC